MHKEENTRKGLEVNGLSTAIMLLESRESDTDIEKAIDYLRKFCDYAIQREEEALGWYEYLKRT